MIILITVVLMILKVGDDDGSYEMMALRLMVEMTDQKGFVIIIL